MISVLFEQSLPMQLRIVLFVTIIVALLFAIVFHELAHGYVALWNGDRTAKLNGRLSLNPVNHFDPIGFIMLILVGFGYAKPVPINTNNFRHRRRGIFTVSIAGVATNFILAFLGIGAYVALEIFSPQNYITIFLSLFLNYFSFINLILCFFNLLPFFPLDGFNIISSFTKPGNKFIRFMRNYSLYFLIVLIGITFIINRFGVADTWMRNLDLLGLYRDYTAGKTMDNFIWIWRKIFGL